MRNPRRLLAAGAAVLFLGLAIALRPEPPLPRRYHYYYFAPETTGLLSGRSAEWMRSFSEDPAAWIPSAAAGLAAIAALVIASRKR